LELFEKEGVLVTYLFNEPPPLVRREKITGIENFAIPIEHYKYWARFMNTNSEIWISVKFGSAKGLIFCVLTGVSNFNYWSKTGKCDDYLYAENEIDFVYEAHTDDDYFFILENNPPLYNNSYDHDFYIVHGNVSFTLQLMVHDFTYANDVHRGSFLQNFDIGNSPWLVFHNPSNTQTLYVEYKLSFRSTLFWIIIIFLFCSGLCCVCWTHAKSNIHVQKRILRETKKLYPGISYDTHVFRKTKKKAHIKLYVPPDMDTLPTPAPMSTPLLGVSIVPPSLVSMASPAPSLPSTPTLTPSLVQLPVSAGILGISSKAPPSQKITGISSTPLPKT